MGERLHAAGKLLHRLKRLTHPSLLVVDEIGYLPISRTGAKHFFQLMSRRNEHGSTVLTSNKSFEEWDEVLGDEVMAAALIDRLLHHCHIVNIRGISYRVLAHSDWGFRVRVCRTYLAKSKGEVERPIHYVRGTSCTRGIQSAMRT